MELHRKEQLSQYLISGFVGGSMAAIVLALGAPRERNHFPELTVDSLVVSERLLVRDDGNDGDAVLVKDGSLFVKHRVVATQFLASQMASAVIVSNRQMTTPDDIFATPADKWQFFTEIGSRCEDGGEILVRSKRGGNCVGREIAEGQIIRVGFDPNESTQLVAHNLAQNTTVSLARQPSLTNPDGTSRRSSQNQLASTVPAATLANPAPAVASAYTEPEQPLQLLTPLPELPPQVSNLPP